LTHCFLIPVFTESYPNPECPYSIKDIYADSDRLGSELAEELQAMLGNEADRFWAKQNSGNSGGVDAKPAAAVGSAAWFAEQAPESGMGLDDIGLGLDNLCASSGPAARRGHVEFDPTLPQGSNQFGDLYDLARGRDDEIDPGLAGLEAAISPSTGSRIPSTEAEEEEMLRKALLESQSSETEDEKTKREEWVMCIKL